MIGLGVVGLVVGEMVGCVIKFCVFEFGVNDVFIVMLSVDFDYVVEIVVCVCM